MSTIFIHYFTGTGNTDRAAGILCNEIKAAGNEVISIRVQKGVSPPKDLSGVQIVAFPVLSWAAPSMMIKYLKQWPDSSESRVSLLAINGASFYKGNLTFGYTGQALEQAERILRKKGYDVFLTGNASFPDNWTQMTNPCDEISIQKIMPLGDAQVLDFSRKLLADKRELYRCGAFNKAWSWVVGILFGLIGRRLLGTFYFSDECCTGCGICAKNCPAGTIAMKKNRPHWKTNCEDCNRCINICPEKAIQVSIPLMLLQIFINIFLCVWLIKKFIYYASMLIAGMTWLKVLIDIPLCVIAIYLAIWVTLNPLNTFFHWLQRFPPVKKFFSISMTRSFRRYVSPGFRPWKE